MIGDNGTVAGKTIVVWPATRGASVGGFATKVGTMAAAALSVGMGIAMGIGNGRRGRKVRLERPRVWRGSCRTKGYYRPKFKGSNAAKAGARMARKRLKLGTRQARSMKRMRIGQRASLAA
jgi:hypothetical protein